MVVSRHAVTTPQASCKRSQVCDGTGGQVCLSEWEWECEHACARSLATHLAALLVKQVPVDVAGCGGEPVRMRSMSLVLLHWMTETGLV